MFVSNAERALRKGTLRNSYTKDVILYEHYLILVRRIVIYTTAAYPTPFVKHQSR